MTANSFASAAAMGLLHIAWTNVNHILLTMLTIPYIPPLLLWLWRVQQPMNYNGVSSRSLYQINVLQGFARFI